MGWATLPEWFWILYYVLLIITLGGAIFSIIRNKFIVLSFLVIIATIVIPIIGLINSIGREDGVNEIEHLISQFQLAELWSIITVIGYGILILWWMMFLLNIKKILRRIK